TGVTLPLVSYGGSSVLTTLIMFFIIEGVYIIRQDEGAKSVRKKKRKSRERRDSKKQSEIEYSEAEYAEENR
ncbi:MAG: FtsW/RodA/SpoVE family cell cycle protein, partial [Lachnospiraceae bacterium]|nr:FtsW/RodA/SpoVE family cell cycle protein [Lachnospiraceae bacterium]